MNKDWHSTPSGMVRARGLGLPFSGTPGPYNNITDVRGVEVGYSTLIEGEDVRTGVTAILPRGLSGAGTPCAAGYSSFNGNGEMSGMHWVEEAGELQTPITITNTHSCGVTRDATLKWMVKNGIDQVQDFGLPVAAETYDGYLSDINGFHVKDCHTFEALDTACSGPLEMGSVGGGTGMRTYEFKGGSASSSRLITMEEKTYTLGVFVQSNFGRRGELTILGAPVGKEISLGEIGDKPGGSIIVIIATDAPLLPHQLKRLARRVPLALGRTGTVGHNGSGDIFLSFSTANEGAFSAGPDVHRVMDYLTNGCMDPLFEAVVEATEEAIIDAMVVNKTMTGRNGHKVYALPHEKLCKILGL